METNLDVLIIVLLFICSILISVSGYPFLGFCLSVYGILRIAYSFIKLI